MRILFFLTFGVGFFVLNTSFVHAEVIDRYDVSIDVGDRGSLRVQELIVVDFGEEIRHGIVRSIPLAYVRAGEEYRIRVRDVRVTDRVGVPVAFDVQRSGAFVAIRVGDASDVTGERGYIVAYVVDGAIGYGDAVDELVWSPIGTDWSVPISLARVHISLPEPMARAQLDVRCVAGAHGATDACGEVKIDDRGDGTTRNILISHEGLRAGEGITVAVIVPKGLILPPRQLSVALRFVADYRYWFLGGAALGAACIGVILLRRRAGSQVGAHSHRREEDC